MSEENIDEEPVKDTGYYFKMGNGQFDKGDYDGAIESYNRAIELDDTVAVYFYNRGIAQHAKGDYDGAIVSYNKAIKLDDSKPAYFNNKGIAQHVKSDYDGAIASYDKAISLDDGNSWYFFNKGYAQQAKGDYDAAFKSYENAINRDGSNSDYFYEKGNSQLAKGDHDGAIVSYDRAIDLKDSDSHYFNNKGVAQSKNRNYDGALESFNEAINLDNSSPRFFHNRGNVYSNKEGKEEGAVSNWYQAFELFEGSAEKNIEAERIYKLVIEKEMSEDYDKSFEMMCYLASSTSFFPDIVRENEIDLQIEKLTLQEIIDISEQSEFYEYNKFLKPVLSNLQKDDMDIGDLKKVFNFLYSINAFKKNRYLAADEDAKNATLYQYTSLDVLKIFLGFKEKEDDEKTKDEKSERIKKGEPKQISLRLNNTNYMNDPTEGSYFVKKVLSGAREPQDEERKEIEKKLLRKNTSHAFIASLTYKKFDDIPMWKMYGRDSKGVAIGFSLPSQVLKPVSEEGPDVESTESKLQTNEDLVSVNGKNGKVKVKINSDERLDEKALLYKIFYYDIDKVEKEKEDSIEERAFKLINQITRAYKELMTVYEKIQDAVQKKAENQEKTEIQKEIAYQKKTLLNFIDWEFDRIKFLVKDIQYKYEDEYRILRLTKDYSETMNDVGSPQLYVEVDDVEIKEVIFGAQSETAMRWSPYIHKVLGDDVEVRDSDTSIKF